MPLIPRNPSTKEVSSLVLNHLVVRIIVTALIVIDQVTQLMVSSRSTVIHPICRDLMVPTMLQLKGVSLPMLLMKLILHITLPRSLKISLIS
jgi:hypothetical protein